MTTPNKYRDELTERQRQILGVIRRLHRKNGIAPTIRELCAAVGMRSTNGMSDVIRKLRHTGHILPAGKGKTRSIVPTPAERPVGDVPLVLAQWADDILNKHPGEPDAKPVLCLSNAPPVVMLTLGELRRWRS